MYKHYILFAKSGEFFKKKLPGLVVSGSANKIRGNAGSVG